MSESARIIIVGVVAEKETPIQGLVYVGTVGNAVHTLHSLRVVRELIVVSVILNTQRIHVTDC